jgi:hypothetical protein
MSSQVLTRNTEAAILARVIEADETGITPDVARYLLSMQLPNADRDRVDQLSARARAGSITDAEEAELDSYLHIGSLLGVMQSRARRLLKKTGNVAPQWSGNFVRRVWRRAGDRCEYCLIPQFAFPLPFQIDHIDATIQVLAINANDLLLIRMELLAEDDRIWHRLLPGSAGFPYWSSG